MQTPPEDVMRRLWFAYRAADQIRNAEGLEIAQVWFSGLNPRLDDASPASVLRNGQLETVGPGVIAAAKSFVDRA